MCVDAVTILQVQTHDGQGGQVRVQLDLVRVRVRDGVTLRIGRMMARAERCVYDLTWLAVS